MEVARLCLDELTKARMNVGKYSTSKLFVNGSAEIELLEMKKIDHSKWVSRIDASTLIIVISGFVEVAYRNEQENEKLHTGMSINIPSSVDYRLISWSDMSETLRIIVFTKYLLRGGNGDGR